MGCMSGIECLDASSAALPSVCYYITITEGRSIEPAHPIPLHLDKVLILFSLNPQHYAAWRPEYCWRYTPVTSLKAVALALLARSTRPA